jgi:hypothetical protein
MMKIAHKSNTKNEVMRLTSAPRKMLLICLGLNLERAFIAIALRLSGRLHSVAGIT